jgi:hypothetical protein
MFASKRRPLWHELPTATRVVFVDWPHARLGSPIVDVVTVLSSVAVAGIDPDPYLPDQLDPRDVNAVLAAHAGFCFAGGLSVMPPGLEPIADAKLVIGRATVNWLERRSTGRLSHPHRLGCNA